MRASAVPPQEPVCGDVTTLPPEVKAARAAYRIALVTMPFALPTRPSLQLGLLAALARSHGFIADGLYLNLDLAACMGLERYHFIACTRNPMFGDWLFSVCAFGHDAPDAAGRMPEELHEFSRHTMNLLKMTGDEIRELRDTTVPAYMDSLMTSVEWSRYRVVGLTSTFQQNAASFALARRIKEAYPEITILCGGANFDGPMAEAWMEAVPAIDFAVRGEADRALPALLKALCHDGDPVAVPGVVGRRKGVVVRGPDPRFLESLDELPVPDYTEYFERAEQLGLLPRSGVREVDIPFESSRGCWWGQKATCTFCGLNGSTMTFRAKSPERVLDELQVLARRHRSLSFTAADNILSLDFLRSVFGPLAASDTAYWIFYEIKASVGREEMRLMHSAGVRALQPGIESLSTRILGLMRKGTRASQNVNFLRWARYYGIELYWNVLLGFPGETEEDYTEQMRLARKLVHLAPPGGSVRIGLERFSPYFEHAERFPVRGGRARPEPGYTHTYPAAVDLHRAAYHFAGELEGTLDNRAYEPLLATLQAWNHRWAEGGDRPTLTFWWSPGVLQIEDRRSAIAPASYCFDDPFAAVYVACSDAPASVAALRHRLTLNMSDAELEATLAEYCRLGLMMQDGPTYLALAVPGTRGR